MHEGDVGSQSYVFIITCSRCECKQVSPSSLSLSLKSWTDLATSIRSKSSVPDNSTDESNFAANHHTFKL